MCIVYAYLSTGTAFNVVLDFLLRGHHLRPVFWDGT